MKLGLPFATLAALALFVSGCSKQAPPPVQQTIDLGVVDLNNGTPNQVDLKNGSTCTITPRSVDGGRFMLQLQIEKNGVVLGSPRVEATSDQPVSVSITDYILKLTPHVK
jgi:hypothetical protein